MGIKKQTETSLVKAIIEFLRLKGIYGWRNNSGAFAAEGRTGKRFVRFGLPGSADVLAVVPPHGRLLAIEAKVGRNNPTDLQLHFGAAINDAGGLWLVIRSLADLEELLMEHGI